ncbi:hypothetical protein EJ04DRAFT_3420 [Polyplosphaeria fusca]|uniref:G-protein coupled receptors family 1 profile domain-containing protein n=1 Tax=Polyplosphaeria fusca TaxID=682080 RepID=A0A9P4V989_9PLEO|nr:hypothetical protein EJ04DRAFT_3420 [Polyplosphaeria fusca]
MAHLEKRYFAYPNSLDPISSTFRSGLIPVALCAMLSLISVTSLLVFITHRLVSWRKHYKEYVGYNQYVILIYNLLLADLQQSIAFSISFHWLRINKIVAPTAPCFIQAWFLHIGDVASGFFVLAIAVHTWMGVVRGYKLPYGWFVVSIICIWCAALLLTIIGPLIHKDHFFARAGGWCWVSIDYERERLWLHYLWIFIVEFGTIIIYGHIFIHLRGRIRSIMHNDTTKLSRATKFMVMYPAVYVVLTLPIAVGRMIAMTGKKLPDEFFCVAGTLLTSCGWIDALLYTLTRRVLVSNQLSSHHTYSNHIETVTNNPARPGDDFGLQSMSKEVGTARTVTIIGGSNRKSRLINTAGFRAAAGRNKSPARKTHSPTESQDSMMKSSNAIGIVTETNIQVETRHADDSDSNVTRGRRSSRNNSESGLSTRSAEPAHAV